MFLRDVERIVERNERGQITNLRVATYAAATKQLVYRTPRALIVNDLCQRCSSSSSSSSRDSSSSTSDTPMLELTSADYGACAADARQVSVLTTLQHELYVALDASGVGGVGGDVSVNEKANDAFRKTTAETLRNMAMSSAAERTIVRLLTVAQNGVDLSSLVDDVQTAPSSSSSSSSTSSSMSSESLTILPSSSDRRYQVKTNRASLHCCRAKFIVLVYV